MSKVRNLAIAILVTGSLTAPLQAAVTPTPLPAVVTTDIAAAQMACTQLQFDQLQLAISRATNDAAGVAADLTLVKADRAAAKSANQALETDARAYLQPASDAVSAADTTFDAAFVQLKSDVVRNPGAVSADKAAILAAFTALGLARAQLQADEDALAGAGATDDPCGHDSDRNHGGHDSDRKHD